MAATRQMARPRQVARKSTGGHPRRMSQLTTAREPGPTSVQDIIVVTSGISDSLRQHRQAVETVQAGLAARAGHIRRFLEDGVDKESMELATRLIFNGDQEAAYAMWVFLQRTYGISINAAGVNVIRQLGDVHHLLEREGHMDPPQESDDEASEMQ